jgi:hypothetical protein
MTQAVRNGTLPKQTSVLGNSYATAGYSDGNSSDSADTSNAAKRGRNLRTPEKSTSEKHSRNDSRTDLDDTRTDLFSSNKRHPHHSQYVRTPPFSTPPRTPRQRQNTSSTDHNSNGNSNSDINVSDTRAAATIEATAMTAEVPAVAAVATRAAATGAVAATRLNVLFILMRD